MARMADRAEWTRRVSEWRASGQPSPEFCKGKPFSPGGLRFWAHKLGETARARPRKVAEPRPVMRIRRVVRVPAPKAEPGPATAPGAPAVREATPVASLVVELGGARITVPPRVDRDALAVVLDLLAKTGGQA